MFPSFMHSIENCAIVFYTKSGALNTNLASKIAQPVKFSKKTGFETPSWKFEVRWVGIKFLDHQFEHLDRLIVQIVQFLIFQCKK